MPKKKTDRTKTSSSAQAFDADVNHVSQTKAAKEDTKEDKPPVTKKSSKPVGKYRHPDYKLVSVYLKKDTTNSAKKLLFDTETDLSELIQDLLGDWVEKNS